MLTDEQLDKLFTLYTYGSITEALNEAYRLGMERAAEIVHEERQQCVMSKYATLHICKAAREAFERAEEAIRAAKGE
jgi:hypothetical protein